MRDAFQTFGTALAVVTAGFGLATDARAGVAYNGVGNYTVINNFTGAYTGKIGYGDDYNTGLASIQLNGLSFVGGLQNQASDGSHLFIDFYNTSGQFVTSINPSDAEVSGFGTHTLAATDFGASGVTVPGAGYIIFAPYTYSTTNPTFSLGGGGSTPTVGTNNSATSAMVAPDANGDRVLTTGTYVPSGFGASPQRVSFSLSAVGVPEPMSLGVILPGAVLALRRRSVARVK